MKKLLALVLALVMTLSLCVVSSNAAFADAADIEHDEAVEVMSALGVINGKGDNKFDPKGNVTRAEMAKMITIITLGDVDVSAFIGTATGLKDVAGHWAEGYINYCFSQGIIAGKGNGMFEPNANVTAAEAAKMLCVAIGYNAKVQVYEGTEWAINVTRDAQLSNFYTDLKGLTYNKVLTRDEATQMIYNAVEAKTITKTPTLTIGTNEVSYTYKPEGDPLMTKTFDAYEYVGLMADVDYDSNTKKFTYEGGTGDYAFTNKNNNAQTKPSFKSKTDYSELYGLQVNVVFTVAKNGDITVVGIYDTGKSVTYEVAQNLVTESSGKVKFNGTKYAIDKDHGFAVVPYDYDSYDVLTFVDYDNDGDLDWFKTKAMNPCKVTYVSSTEIIAGGTTYKVADNDIAEGLAKKDYVTVVKNADGSYTIEKIAPVTGKVTGEKIDSNNQKLAQVDGTWYNKNTATMNVDKTYTFYAVNGVVVTGSVDESSASIANLVQVVAASTGLKRYEAMVLDANGNTEVVALDTTGVYEPTVGNLYTFVETEKGYKLTAAASIGTDYTWVDGANNDVNDTNVQTNKKLANTYVIADDCVVFVVTKDGGMTVTGKQLKNMNSTVLGYINDKSNGAYTAKVNGLTRVVYLAVDASSHDSKEISSVSSKNYAYVTSSAYTVSSSYKTYSLWTGSENVTVIDKNGSNTFAKGTVIGYESIDADGYITDAQNLSADAVAITGFEGDYVYVDGTNDTAAGKLVKDTKYIYIDSNADTADEIGMADGELVKCEEYVTGAYLDNALIKVVSGEVSVIVVDVKNQLTVSANKTVDTDKTALTAVWGTTGAKISADGVDKTQKGAIVTITLKNNTPSTISAKTITLTNAKYLDGTAAGAGTISVPSLAAGASVEYTLIVTGDVSFSVS